MISEGTKVWESTISKSIANYSTKYSRKSRRKTEYFTLLKLLIGLCCVHGVRSNIYRSIKDLKAAVNTAKVWPSFGHCDFEDSCDWLWNRTGGFIRADAATTYNRPLGPFADASGTKNGEKFYFAFMIKLELTSQWINVEDLLKFITFIILLFLNNDILRSMSLRCFIYIIS